MTAIDDILKAEQEAANAIEEAKLSAEKKLTAAKSAHEAALADKRTELRQAEVEALGIFTKELETKTKAATVALSGDADHIRHQFSEKKDELTKFVKASL